MNIIPSFTINFWLGNQKERTASLRDKYGLRAGFGLLIKVKMLMGLVILAIGFVF